jgi:hypothetical protein
MATQEDLREFVGEMKWKDVVNKPALSSLYTKPECAELTTEGLKHIPAKQSVGSQ